MADGASIYVKSGEAGLRQCEILSDVVQAIADAESPDDDPVVDLRKHPLAIVISQDCDLDWDYKARLEDGEETRKIPSVLLCEVITAEVLRHTEGINSPLWSRIRANNAERYHFLQKVPADADRCEVGLPELAVDFKRYFTVSTDHLYATLTRGVVGRRCCLTVPYRDHFSTRFARFMSRIALPEPHFSEPVK